MSMFDNTMEIISVKVEERYATEGSSKGNQPKWFSKEKFIKLDSLGYESDAEVLVSQLLKYSSIKNYVEYYKCIVEEDGKILGTGCYSYDFLKKDEIDITFHRLFKLNGTNCLSMTYAEIREDLFQITGRDFKSYIDNCLCLDAITKNEDRHFNNLSVIYYNGIYNEAPIYDNGLSCLSDLVSYPENYSIDYLINTVRAKPFKSNFKDQIKYCNPIKINAKEFLKYMDSAEGVCTRAKEVLKYGLEEMRGIAWEEY